jgi:hypothetical protein
VTTLHLSFLVLGWTAVPGASHYEVFREGSLIGSPSTNSYSDASLTIGSTYHYTVQAYDQYGQSGPVSSSVSAFINPALDQPPVVAVRVWPNPVVAGSKAFVRVNANSLDGLTLADALNVDVGQLTPTWDGSLWYLTV